MSDSLPVRAKTLRERLVTLDQLGTNVEEADQLEDLRSDLAAPAAALSRAVDQRTLLVDAGIAMTTPVSLDAARKRAVSLIEKFSADRQSATLKKGVTWTNLLRDIGAASTDVANSVLRSWKEFREEVFTGDAPAVIKGRIAFTQANDAVFKRYEQLYRAFRAEFDRPPADRASIERVRAVAAELTATVAAFDFDVPAEVKRFLEAVQSGDATLDLLTDTVTKWLKDNHAFTSYRIVPRSADGIR